MIGVVLPPGEAFSPAASGAIGLLVHRLARAPGRFPVVVLGREVPVPFPDVPFRAIRPRWALGGATRRYAAGAVDALGDADLVEVHNRPDVALYLARRLAPVPVSVTLHNDPRGMRDAAELGRLAAVFTVSQYLRGRIAVPAVRETTRVLPNCLDLADVPAPPASRERLILFAGRVVADKGADAFVAACALALPRLAGWRADMVGADRFGPDSPETPFLRALRPRAAAAGVTMAGYQPHGQVLAAMAAASIVVVPSRWAEPFGLTALEAMASGAALLCSGRGGLAEVAGDVGVLVDPDDPAAMAEALVGLASDPARVRALGAAGQARAARFDVGVARRALDAARAGLLHLPPDELI